MGYSLIKKLWSENRNPSWSLPLFQRFFSVTQPWFNINNTHTYSIGWADMDRSILFRMWHPEWYHWKQRESVYCNVSYSMAPVSIVCHLQMWSLCRDRREHQDKCLLSIVSVIVFNFLWRDLRYATPWKRFDHFHSSKWHSFANSCSLLLDGAECLSASFVGDADNATPNCKLMRL